MCTKFEFSTIKNRVCKKFRRIAERIERQVGVCDVARTGPDDNTTIFMLCVLSLVYFERKKTEVINNKSKTNLAVGHKSNNL